jgi:hypothetical protein
MPERPRVGASVWVEGIGNGEIRYIDWEGDKEVIVHFHYLNIQETYEWYQFDNFHERLRQWIIGEMNVR